MLILINLKKIKQIVQPSTDNSIYCCLDIEVRILIEIFAILSIISKIPLLIPVRIPRWLSIFNGKIHNLSAKGSYVYQWIFVSHFHSFKCKIYTFINSEYNIFAFFEHCIN